MPHKQIYLRNPMQGHPHMDLLQICCKATHTSAPLVPLVPIAQ